MDIKDSYLHGTVGVVKSINVDGDKIKYTLADVANTTKTVALPLATTTNNGLAPKVINTNTATVNSSYYVLASTNGSAAPSWYKLPANSFSNDDTKVTQTNTTTSASYRVLFSGNANDTTETTTARKSANLLFDPSTGTLSSTYINTKGLKGQAESLEDLMKSGMALTYHRFIKPSFSNETGITVSGNANGVIWVGTHEPEGDNTSGIGYGHMLGFVGGKGALYHKVVVNGDTTKAWKQIAYTTSNITGNAASADKLQTVRKLWGLDFDGSADVSGNMTGVGNVTMNGDILINSENNDRYLIFSYANLDRHSWRLGYLGIGTDAANYFVLQGTKTATGGNYTNALYFNNSNFNATFAAAVTATSFIGNLDGTYVNKLTGYSKATSAGNIASTDTLNTALGKLEYKADTAYNWYKSVTADDTDTLVNKWGEIVDFLDSVAEGTDITDEFVTRKTKLTIIGAKIFEGSNADLITINRINNSNPTWLKFNKNGELLGYVGVDDSEKLVFMNSDNTRKTVLHSANTYISNGTITINGTNITPLTSHQSLANYVTLNTGLTITGEKTFTNKITIETTSTNKTPKIVFDEYYTSSNPSWVSEIVSDYYGKNVCTTDGFTHGLYIKLGRNGTFSNLNILDADENPIARISKVLGHWFDGKLSVTDSIVIPNKGSNALSGMTNASIMYDSYTSLNSTGYHPILGVKTNGGNVVNLGAYVNGVGFYGYKNGRTENGWDWRFIFDSSTGALSHSSSITATKFIGNVTGNVSGSATYLPITQINNESEISNSGIRGYLGSGTNWTGENSMGYSAILSVGNASRGFRLWSGRGDTGCLNYYIGNQEGNAWSSARKILDSNNYSDYTATAITWSCPTTVGTWSRICSISGYSSIILSIVFFQTNQASTHTYLISSGYNSAKITQIGYNNYDSNFDAEIRITKNTDTSYYIEVLNKYGNTTLSLGCRAIIIDSKSALSPIKTYTEGSGTVISELVSAKDKAVNFNADLLDGKHASDFVTSIKVGSTSYSPSSGVISLPTYPTSLKNPNAIKFKNAAGTVVSYDGSTAVDLTAGVNYATTATHLNNLITLLNANDTNVGSIKTKLLEVFGNISYGVGSSVVIPSETITKWNNDSYEFTHGGKYTAIKLSGGYSGNTYGLWLLSSYGDLRLYYIGLSGGEWTPLREIAITDDIPTKVSQLTNDSGYLTSRGYIGTTAVQATSAALALTGITNGDFTGKILLGRVTRDFTDYPETDTYKMGRDVGDIHFKGALNNTGNSITWSYGYDTNADAGIYVKHDGNYGSKMYFATTNNWSNGPIAAMEIDLQGNITALKSKFIGTLQGSASKLTSTSVISAKAFSLINTTWTDTGYTFANLATGTYAVQVTSGTNLVASGIMSVCKNLEDTTGDEIPLHVYHKPSSGNAWRPYLRTYQNKLQISSNDNEEKSRTVTIKIAQIL